MIYNGSLDRPQWLLALLLWSEVLTSWQLDSDNTGRGGGGRGEGRGGEMIHMYGGSWDGWKEDKRSRPEDIMLKNLFYSSIPINISNYAFVFYSCNYAVTLQC